MIEPVSNMTANHAVCNWHNTNPLPDLHLSFCYGLYEYNRLAGAGIGCKTLLGVAMVGNLVVDQRARTASLSLKLEGYLNLGSSLSSSLLYRQNF